MTMPYDTLPRGRALRIEDLEATPDDGNRYELIDGVLVVSAAPRPVHAFAGEGLADVLRACLPPGWRVMTTEVGVVLADDTEMIPDITVYPPLGGVPAVPGHHRSERSARLGAATGH
ncbi:Uma2 family endonuclease [Nocardioides sp.]|uniref:Uma2 family endonuclease n=1 Tax=Nocardioides sp. TaxID=35761 RepID=UPI0039E239A1